MLTGFYLFLFWGYLLRIRTLTNEPQLDHFLFGAAILFRVLLLFAPPLLSDDYFRFAWDGRLLAQGFNPYLYLPSTVINAVPGLDEPLFQRLNSPQLLYLFTHRSNQAFFRAGCCVYRLIV